MSARRAPRGRTFDPCHGCGQVPSAWNGRAKDQVCNVCATNLALAKKVAEDQTRADLRVVTVPTAPHWLPYLHRSRSRPDRADVQAELWKLAILCSVPAMSIPAVKAQRLVPLLDGDRTDWSASRIEDYRSIPAAVADQFAVLYNALRHELVDCYNEGKREGQNLLGQLASGDITANEFNDLTLRERRR